MIDKQKQKQKEVIRALKKEVKRYSKAYSILAEYFDSISDEEQPKVSKKLQKLGL